MRTYLDLTTKWKKSQWANFVEEGPKTSEVCETMLVKAPTSIHPIQAAWGIWETGAVRMVFSFIWRIRKNQQGSTQLSQPHTRVRVIGELKQHGGSKVRLLKNNSGEQLGARRCIAVGAEDWRLSKGKELQCRQRLRRGRRRNKWGRMSRINF